MSISPCAIDAFKLVSDLQSRFVRGLGAVSCENGASGGFALTEWLRDGGTHGGGNRYTATDAVFFDRASVNVSQIHYGDLPEKKLASATAISTIIHPRNPHCPSVHIHISWTEMKGGAGYWRLMADLNPAVQHEEFRDEFVRIMQEAAPSQYEAGAAQGDKYFYIPALGRHRGVAHFYLESYRSDDPAADRELAEVFGKAVIDGYLGILTKAAEKYSGIDEADREAQLAYHTLYLFQVLTLDRGTTSGLLVHDQNDLGIMGSLPSHVDRGLLASWREKVSEVQRGLVEALLRALPDGEGVVTVTDEVKLKLAKAVRGFYQGNPEALELQASGGVIPPTVENHR
ncbi:MAG: coproporphyrinogen III oxidase [Verrucomicrobiales bacterium]|nr:coproporphyrinogen III oxidase [Verrucomicrobiales bacterium]